MATRRDFQKFGDRLAARALLQARPLVQSRTLKAAMRPEVEATASGVRASLVIPHYWAVYYHDGRGPVRAKPGKKLVFYKRVEDDPRLVGGFPERATQIRKLTKAQFYRDLKAGKLIAVESVRGTQPRPFFERGMRPFRRKVGPIADKFVEECIVNGLREDKSLNVKERATARLRL